MSNNKLVELFKTGDFTIIYWDSSSPTIYKGKWNYNKEFEKDDYKEMNKHEVKMDEDWDSGYLPTIVELLTRALGGKSDSI